MPTALHPFFAGGPLVIAHRGASAYAPENTRSAFELGLEMGAHALEADIRLTRDGVPVAVHDRRLERLTERRGFLRTLSYAELRALDPGYRWSPDGGRSFPFRGRGLRIFTVESLLRAFPTVRFVFHLKSAGAARAARRQIEAVGAEGRALVAAEWSWRLAPFRGFAGLRGAATEAAARFVFRSWFGLPPRARRPLLVPLRRGPIPVLTPRFVARAHAAGQPVVAWVINRREEMARLFEWGVDAIETDRPDVGLAALREWRSKQDRSRIVAAGS